MAADVTEKQAPFSSCCQLWRDRCSNLQEKRNALRQALKLFEQQLDKIQAEYLSLKKVSEEERACAAVEKEGREKELAARLSLETEISALKSEISKLQQKGRSHAEDKNEEVKLLQVRVFEGEKEIKLLKELLEKEKTRADSEKKSAEAEKKRATEAWKYVKAEKCKADEERRLANIEGKKAEEYRHQLEALSKEADDAKSKLVSLTLKLEEGNKKLEAEKQKVTKERKRADLEMNKTEKQRKIAEANRKLAEGEKCRVENLSRQLEEARKKIEELQKEIHELVHSRYSGETPAGKREKNTDTEFSKVNRAFRVETSQRVGGETTSVLEYSKYEEASKSFGVEKQKAIDDKKCADSETLESQEHKKLVELKRDKATEENSFSKQNSRQLEEARARIDELQKQIYHLLSSSKTIEDSVVIPKKYWNADSGKIKLLKKQLKFEKMKVKHTREVAKLEKSCNIILRQELRRLKSDFIQFSHRLDVMDKCFLHKDEGTDNPGKEKVRNRSDMQMLKLKEKVYGVEPFQMYLQSENELLNPGCMAIAASDAFVQTLKPVVPSLSLSGGNCGESVSGIDSKDSKLGSLLGGSSQKMLRSSAINSSSASFSDGLFVGSQEKSALSVTTSSKLIEESLNAQQTNSSMSGEVNKMRCSRNRAVVAEDGVRSPLKIVGIGNGNGPSKKRKGVLDAIEFIELLHSEGRKLHLQMEEKLSDLHNILNRQVDKSLEEADTVEPNLQDNSYVKHELFHKKRKVSHKENEVIQQLYSSDQPKETEKKIDANIHKDAWVPRQASQPTIDLLGTAQACAEDISDSVVGELETLRSFDEVAYGDYMKLLDLDNPFDEECYRKAMEMPLSPTLPEIEFQGDETLDMGKLEPLAEESLYRSLSNEKENRVPPCGFDFINVEINSNSLEKSVSRNSHTLSIYENKGPVDSFNVRGVTMDEGVKFPSKSELGAVHNNIPKYFVVFRNCKDNSSISRIFCATKTCMDRCSLVTRTEWILQKILLALKMEEKLLSKERASVFFSLLLINLSKDALGKSGNFWNREFTVCLDSFARHVSAVMSDVEARSLFDELCLDELLTLIEDFLMDGKVMRCTGASGTWDENNSQINSLLDSVNTIFSHEAASTDQLVAGSIILASISAATDCIGFICEASYNIFRMHRSNSSLVLTILHIFAYLGGEDFFTLRKYNLTMTVLKSTVTCLERGSLPVAATPFLPSASEVETELHPCAECPFSKDAVSADIAISLLLEKLQSYAQPGTTNLHSHTGQIGKSCLEFYHVLDMNCCGSCFLNKYEMPSFQSESVVNMTLCHVTDVLSLVELLACNMRWDWTYTTIIPELLRMLESPMQESFTVAIVILLGQLGRLGVDACGHEDTKVESLRRKLSAFLFQDTTARAGLPIQIATVTALLGLLSLDFNQIVQINEKCPAVTSQSLPADHLRRWFSSLSKENQALSLSLLQCSD